MQDLLSQDEIEALLNGVDDSQKILILPRYFFIKNTITGIVMLFELRDDNIESIFGEHIVTWETVNKYFEDNNYKILTNHTNKTALIKIMKHKYFKLKNEMDDLECLEKFFKEFPEYLL